MLLSIYLLKCPPTQFFLILLLSPDHQTCFYSSKASLKSVLGYGDCSVGKELATHMWGPEFKSPEPTVQHKQTCVALILILFPLRNERQKKERSWCSQGSREQQTDHVSDRVEGEEQHPRNYLLTSIHARSFTNTQRRSHVLTHAYTYAYTHVHTPMYIHICIYLYIYTCTYSYKHVHTYMQSLNRVFPISKQSFLFFF